jgi:hypothetical protein
MVQRESCLNIGDRKMYRRVLLSLLCVGLLCSVATAGDGVGKWIGGASGDWSNSANWYAGAIPGAGTDVYSEKLLSDFTAEQLTAITNFEATCDMTNAAVVATTCPSAAGWTRQTINTASSDVIAVSAMHLSNQNACASTVLNINCNVAVAGDFYLTDCTYGATEINQYAGDTTVGGQLRLPRAYNGVYNIYGGTLTAGSIRMPRRGYNYDGGTGFAVTQAAGGVGDMTTADGKTPMEFAKSELNIYGGVVTTGDLGFSVNDPFGVITIYSGGQLVLLGNQLDAANAWISAGHIVGTASFDGTNTIVIPEPATLVILGLGALGLIRRNRK